MIGYHHVILVRPAKPYKTHTTHKTAGFMVIMFIIYRCLYTLVGGEYRLVRSTTTIRVRKDVHRFLKRKAEEYGCTIGDYIYRLATGKALPDRVLSSVPVGVVAEPIQSSLVRSERPRGYIRREDWHG